MNTIYDCIIIGSGISGLTFAHHLAQYGENILVLEQKSRIGGQIHTIETDRTSSHWSELGAHTCYNSYTYLLSVIDDIKVHNQIIPVENLKYVLYKKKKIKSILSEISILSFAFNFPKLFFNKQDQKTVKEYFAPIVGKSNYTPLFSNLFRAVICQNADHYPSQLFLKRRKHRRQDVPRKFTFKKGITTFLKSIISHNSIQIHTEIEVVNISQTTNTKNPLFIITTAEGQTYQAHNLALATDPITTSLLIHELDHEVSKLLSTIPLSRSESRTVTIEEQMTNIKKIAGIIPLSDDFMSAVSRDVIPSENLRSFTFHFEQGKKSSDEQQTIINTLLAITPDNILAETSCSHQLPSLRIEHLDMSQKIDKIRQSNNIYICGNYFYGLSLEDCAHRSYEEAIRYKKNKKP